MVNKFIKNLLLVEAGGHSVWVALDEGCEPETSTAYIEVKIRHCEVVTKEHWKLLRKS